MKVLTAEHPKITVCILTHQGKDVLDLCLQSVFRQKGPFEVEVFVTDNASTDGTVEMMRNKFPEVNLIVSDQNRSFTGPYNEMARQATGDFIAIVNNDIEFTEDRFFETALDIMRKNPEIGMLAPKSIKPNDETERINKPELSFQEILYAWTPIGPLLSRLYSGLKHTQHFPSQDASQYAAVLQDSAVLLRRDAIEGDSLYDDRFGFYFTEDDISIRLRRKGWKLFYSTDIQVRHRHQYSTKKISKMKYQWIYMRDVIAYSRKFCGRIKTAVLLEPAAYLTYIFRALYWYMTDKSKWK